MRPKTTLLLLGIAVVLILFIQLYEKKKPSTDEWQLQQAKVFPDFKPDRVSQIEIKRESGGATPDEGLILIKKIEEGKWLLEKPRQVRADATEVKGLLGELEFLGKVGTVSPEGGKPVDLASYGLDKPRIEASYWTGPTQADRHTFYVGAGRAGGSEVYMRHEGGKEVYMVQGSLMDKLTRSLNDLRNKDVFEIDPNAVQRMELRYGSGGDTIKCLKEGETWRLESPVADMGDNEKVMQVIYHLRGLTVAKEDFITDEEVDLNKFGLGNPQLVATVQEKGQTQTLLLGNTKDNKVYAKRQEESAVFFLKDNTVNLLKKNPNELRDKKLARFDPLYVSKLEIKTRDQNVVIEKTKEYDYLITQPVNVLADRDAVKGFMDVIKELEVQNFVSNKPDNLATYGLDQPEADITITLKDEPKPIKLQLGKKDERGILCYVKRTGGEPVFAAKVEKLHEPATRGYLAFRDKLVLEFNRDKAQKLVMERGDKHFLLEKSSGQEEKWFLKEPLEVEADEDIINNIVWSLSFLKVDRHVEEGPKDLKPYGLGTPRLRATITYGKGLPMAEQTESKILVAEKEPELESQTLLVGRKVKEGENTNSYAMLQGSNLVFEMSWTEVRYLESEPASKMVVRLEYPEVTGVSITYPEKEIVYQKKAEAWEMMKPEQKPVATREIESILYNLKNLKADDIHQYSAKELTPYGLDKPLFKLTLNTEHGEKSIIMGNHADKGMHYVKSSGSDFVFLISHEKLEKLMKEKPVREASKAPAGG